MRRYRPLLTGLVVMLAASGCADGLRFSRDDRLRFIAPKDRSLVQTPVAIRWSVPRPPGHVIAVFVDRPPVRPNVAIQAVAEADPYCRRETGCPNASWLAERGVLLTRRSGIVLDALPADRGRRLGDRRLHDVTLVLLDRNGVRVGEAAWRLTFFTRETGR